MGFNSGFKGLIAFENYKLTAHAISVLKIYILLLVFYSADRQM